jgi:hypothetical protein
MIQKSAAFQAAEHGCGQSDVIFSRRVNALPPEERAALGYPSEGLPEPALADGECPLTGVEVDHCPCGRHA